MIAEMKWSDASTDADDIGVIEDLTDFDEVVNMFDYGEDMTTHLPLPPTDYMDPEEKELPKDKKYQ